MMINEHTKAVKKWLKDFDTDDVDSGWDKVGIMYERFLKLKEGEQFMVMFELWWHRRKQRK